MRKEQSIGLDWIRQETRKTLERNRVREVREWNGVTQECVYHAPLLERQVDYPSWLPAGLKGMWRLWWRIQLPWKATYPHQWFWDSCAHAVVLSHLDIALAEKEVKSLLYAQREDGFIPHMIWNLQKMHWIDRIFRWLYGSRLGSPYLQPPALAEAVEQIWQKGRKEEFIRSILPQLKKYYLYLGRERQRNGLVEIILSYESGKDRSPEYDPIYGKPNTQPTWRGPMMKVMVSQGLARWDLNRIFASNRFRVKDLLFNCIYAQNLFSLSRLCQLCGEKDDAELFQGEGQRGEEAILSQMYDRETGLFYSLDARYDRDQQIKVNTVSSLMPLTLDTIRQTQVERLVREHLLNPQEFWTNYPLPAEPLYAVKQERGGHIIWRGLQTWVYPNWYVVRGLRKQARRFPEHQEEYRRIADEITWQTYQMIRGEGFCDFYHSQTGKGSVARGFGWSTLILDMVVHQEDSGGLCPDATI